MQLPLGLAVETIRTSRLQSTAAAVALVQILLTAYPEGARQTGYPEVSLAGRRFEWEQTKRDAASRDDAV